MHQPGQISDGRGDKIVHRGSPISWATHAQIWATVTDNFWASDSAIFGPGPAGFLGLLCGQFSVLRLGNFGTCCSPFFGIGPWPVLGRAPLQFGVGKMVRFPRGVMRLARLEQEFAEQV